jgi:hypothetical protein
VLYRDRYTFIGPLAYESTRLLIDAFGPGLLVGRIAQALVFTLTAIAVYAILRVFADVRWATLGAIACLPLKPLAFPLGTIPNYAQLAMLLSLGAVAAGLRFLSTGRASWLVASGVAAGLTVVAKQSLGAAVAAAVAVAVALDAVARRRAVLRTLTARALLLAGSASIPILGTVGFYGAQGALGAFVDRAVVGLVEIAPAFHVPLPPLDVWSLDPKLLGAQSFRYFPTPVLALAWQSGLDLYARPTAIAIEHAVKALYYLPLVAMALAGLGVVRGLRAEAGRPEACRLAMVVAYAATAYGSIVYRADFTHLMSVAPPVLIVCVLALHRAFAGRGRGAAVPGAAGAAWLAVGALAAVCVVGAYDTPIDTRHGRIRATAYDADDAARVLSHLARQPADARILILRTDPLYYVLSDRAIPGPFDLLLPGYLRPGDDARFADGLARVDRILYNPTVLPTVPTPLASYAPATAARLAAGFRIDEILGPSAVALVPREGMGSDAATVVAIRPPPAEGRPGPGPASVAPADWMMYRVVTTTLEPHASETCFALRHDVAAGESIRATPMLNPATWAPRFPLDEGRRVRFEIRVTPASEPRRTVFSGIRDARIPAEEVRVPLAPFAGRRVEIAFCALRPTPEVANPQRVPAGWAEPRIVRARGGEPPSGGA